MNIVVEKQPKCVATLRVEIPADKVQGQRDQIVRGYASKARIPGFRPGKAPRAVVEKRFEKEIAEELNDKLVNEAYDEALKQESLKVLDFGMPEDLTTHAGRRHHLRLQTDPRPRSPTPGIQGRHRHRAAARRAGRGNRRPNSPRCKSASPISTPSKAAPPPWAISR